MKLAALAGVAGLFVVVVLATHGLAAERVASPAAAGNPMADITDVYAWMTGSNLNLVMDVSPMDNGQNSFGPGVVYVFHLTSKPGLGVTASGGTETQAICRFASNTSVECWVTDATGTKDYVTGDPTNTAGITSLRGRVKVFAGRRSDPAFADQTGFAAGISAIKSAPAAQLDPAGCPMLDAGTALSIRRALAGGNDTFATANVMAIVLQIDKALVNADSNTTVAVWGATHAVP